MSEDTSQKKKDIEKKIAKKNYESKLLEIELEYMEEKKEERTIWFK